MAQQKRCLRLPVQVQRAGAFSRDGLEIKMNRFAQAAQFEEAAISPASSPHGKILL